MQQIEQTTGTIGMERQRIEAVVETLANLRNQGESLAEVAHDARNMVTALGLYCDLLEQPGVLATPFSHYGNELRLVASASRRLVEKLVELDHHEAPRSEPNFGAESTAILSRETCGWYPLSSPSPSTPQQQPQPNRHWDLMPAELIDNLAAELLANRNLLAALSGPAIALTADTDGGALPVRLTGEDLTRVLINLIKNAAEAMPSGGRIQIALREHQPVSGPSHWLALTVEDNGPGIPEAALEKIFESGYTSPATGASPKTGWHSTHRGLGLSITRSIVEAAGGRVWASNRASGGARFEIELPART